MGTPGNDFPKKVDSLQRVSYFSPLITQKGYKNTTYYIFNKYNLFIIYGMYTIYGYSGKRARIQLPKAQYTG